MVTAFTTVLSVPYVAPWEIYAASIVLPFLGIFFVLLRFYARTLQKKALKKKMTGIDDWLMLPALILVIGMGICLIIGVQRKAIAYSTPLNENLTPEEQFEYVNPTVKTMGMIQYTFVILMVLAFGIVKLSITFYYRRIFVIANGLWFDWITKAAIAIVVLWTVGFLFACIFICGTHVFANWSSALDGSMYCGPSLNIDSAFVVSDLVTDVVVLCMPLPVIWSIKMTMGNKLIVTGILATGAVSIVASIIKVTISFEITNTDAHYDPNLTVSTILYWSMIEGGLAIIAACLPTIRFLVGKVSLSGILHSLRSVFTFGSIQTQQQQQQQQPQQQLQGSPPHSEELYTHIHASSSLFLTSDTTRQQNQNPINMGEVDESQENGMQVTRHFSQNASMV